jgi:two-component system phosphate regulon sensor histidine kinase PhoR
MALDEAGGAISARPAQLLEALGRHLDEALLIVDAGRRLRYANAAARVMLALRPDSDDTRFDDMVVDFRIPLMVRACLSQGEEIVRDLDDPIDGRHLVARAIPIIPAGGTAPVEVAVLLRDESRIRRLETVRRDFVANVSHELRTPVAAIQLLVETLQGGAIDEPAVAGEFVSKIGLEVAHMAQIVAELLELSAIESGARPMRPAPTSVTELVTAAERLRPLAKERRLELRFRIEPGTPPVLGDAERLGQVVRNLVHNAIKFTPEGGVVTMSARGLHDNGRSMVELRVSDTGCGISPEEASRVFERFYKADRSRQRDGEGTGLGLAIARHTVEAHGGSISVASEPGRGSTFTVVVPAATT